VLSALSGSAQYALLGVIVVAGSQPESFGAGIAGVGAGVKMATILAGVGCPALIGVHCDAEFSIFINPALHSHIVTKFCSALAAYSIITHSVELRSQP
jgi:hypothetical protein